MRNITIGFSKSKKKLAIGSMAIRLFEGTKFSHVYIKHNTRYEIPIIYQATGAGVNFVSMNSFNKHHEIVDEFNIQVTDDNFDRYMKFALSNSGDEYSHMQILGIALAKIFRLDKNPFYESKYGYVCSELVFTALGEMGTIKIDKDSNLVTPRDLYLLIKQIV